jgi:hypothetical protein
MHEGVVEAASILHDLLADLTPLEREEIFSIVRGDYCTCGAESPCYCSSTYDE